LGRRSERGGGDDDLATILASSASYVSSLDADDGGRLLSRALLCVGEASLVMSSSSSLNNRGHHHRSRSSTRVGMLMRARDSLEAAVSVGLFVCASLFFSIYTSWNVIQCPDRRRESEERVPPRLPEPASSVVAVVALAA
jgi:hypothetical protein